MASRYYSVQWCHSKQGWLDLPSLASKSLKEAADAAELFAEEHKVTVRTIRKPHGWAPGAASNAPNGFMSAADKTKVEVLSALAARPVCVYTQEELAVAHDWAVENNYDIPDNDVLIYAFRCAYGIDPGFWP